MQSVQTMLQWGRDLSVADTGRSKESSTWRYRLQWGRDLSVADTGSSTWTRYWPLLQWGRDLSVADTGAARGLPDSDIPASMGPRPFSRGHSLDATQRAAAVCRLQWGRDLSVADTRGPRPFSRGGPSLQWGRDLSVADTRARPVGHHASMGPRPFSRGHSLRAAITVKASSVTERLTRTLTSAEQLLVV